MPTAPKLDWPQGQPLFQVQWRAISEALAGNGLLGATDMEVTATANALEIQVAAGTVFYNASEWSESTASTFTLTSGDSTYDRWDTVYYNTDASSSTPAPAPGVRTGTAAADPVPPDISGDEVLLAVIYVPAGASDVSGSNILNWRAQFSNEAEDVHYNDSTATYGVSNVAAALDDLQEAVQISAYPLALGDLASPYALPSITDMDAAGTDLIDSAVGTGVTIWDTSAGVVPQAQLGGPASSLTSYPLPIGDLSSPFALPNITDMDAAGTNITDSTAGVTVYDATAVHVPRPQVDDHHATTLQTSSSTNTAYQTSDEEVVMVDTATNGVSYTVTLASADAMDGNVIQVIDVGGGAASNNITIDTQGTSETIDGVSSKTIDSDYSGLAVISDGSNWFTAGGGTGGGGTASTEIFEGRESGSVSAGNQGILCIDNLAVDETVEVYKCGLTTATGAAVASSVDLELVTFDNAGAFTSQSVLINSDGTTVYDDVTGNPVASYTNTGTSAVSIGVIVDNGKTTAANVMAYVEGQTGL